MPKRELTPPEPQQQYEGYEWLSAQWGRSGNPVPARIGAAAMGLAALIVIGWTIRGVIQDAGALFVLVSAVVASLCAIGTGFYLAEAHFAARAAREQQPFTPDLD
jgi:hypothetical protein